MRVLVEQMHLDVQMIASSSKIYTNAICQEESNAILLAETESLIMLLFIILLFHTTIMRFVMKEPLEMMLDVRLHVQSFILIIHVQFQVLLANLNVEMDSMILVLRLSLLLLDRFTKCASTQHLQSCRIDLNTCS